MGLLEPPPTVCKEGENPVLTLAPTLTCLVNLDELLHLSEPQFLHLWKDDER